MINKLFKNDILIRAVKTFLQSFLAVLAVGIVSVDLDDFSALYALLVAAVAAGISAVMNYAKEKLK